MEGWGCGCAGLETIHDMKWGVAFPSVPRGTSNRVHAVGRPVHPAQVPGALAGGIVLSI